jgi:thiol-disulfide isomerase/thioredoxin
METANIYNTDIEMITDFMKLSLIYDNKNISDKERFDIIILQKSIIELLPVAQSNRMSTIYGILADIYRRNKTEIVNHTKKPLFASSSRNLMFDKQSDQNVQIPIPNTYESTAHKSYVQSPYMQISTRQHQRFNEIPSRSTMLENIPDRQVLKNQKEDHVIVLFYRSTCPACQKIMGDWIEFKRQHKDSNFSLIDYDNDNPDNKQIFQYFKIEFVPTIFKLTFDALDKNKITTKMNSEINLANLHSFVNF